MGITNEKLNKWLDIAQGLYIFDPTGIIDGEILLKYLQGELIELSDEEKLHIDDSISKLKVVFDGEQMKQELEDEISLNVAFIDNNDTVLRYLNYTNKRLTDQIGSLKDDLREVFLTFSKIRFSEKITQVPEPNSIFLNPLASLTDKILALEVGQGFAFPIDGGDGYFIFDKHKDHISKYLRAVMHVVSDFKSVQKDVEKNLRAHHPLTAGRLDLENDLEHVNHRILLFHRLGLFTPLYQRFFNLLGPSNFNKLIGTVIGVRFGDSKEKGETNRETFRKAMETFIKEINNTPVNKPVLTATANKTVDAFLTKMGLSTLIDNK